jgi:hypothetical protein
LWLVDHPGSTGFSFTIDAFLCNAFFLPPGKFETTRHVRRVSAVSPIGNESFRIHFSQQMNIRVSLNILAHFRSFVLPDGLIAFADRDSANFLEELWSSLYAWYWYFHSSWKLLEIPTRELGSW